MNTLFRAVLLALVCTPAIASAGELSLNGFLSAGGGIVLEDDVSFVGYDDKLSFRADNVLGLQADADLGDGLAATAQFVARGNDDYDVSIEWAYVAKQLSENWRGRAGRLRVPFFMASDYLEVGYAYPWIRPPGEVYDRLPFSGFDGVDFLYNGSLGDWSTSFQAYYGTEGADQVLFGNPSSRELDGFSGVVFGADYDWLALRASYHRADVTFDIPALAELFATLNALGFASVAEDLDVKDKLGEFIELGVNLDRGNWFARGEYTELLFDRSLLTDAKSWYATGGVRSGDFTFHLTYADTASDTKSSFSTPIPAGIDPGLDVLKGTVEGLTNQVTEYNSVTLGMRWDMMSNIAFKTEYQQVNDERTDQDFGLFSFAFDVTF